LDPPFKQGLVAVSLDWLLENAALAPAAFVYVEAEKGLGLAAIADARGFTIYRHKQAGLVQYALLRKTGRQESRKE
ncbi:MAG: RsmD family RNA methyltransferase, partial [Gammaproteobacteria bacterium]|nr:RsmD family RNA methyltransferase [Gammaproteobacteria bacterium]